MNDKIQNGAHQTPDFEAWFAAVSSDEPKPTVEKAEVVKEPIVKEPVNKEAFFTAVLNQIEGDSAAYLIQFPMTTIKDKLTVVLDLDDREAGPGLVLHHDDEKEYIVVRFASGVKRIEGFRKHLAWVRRITVNQGEKELYYVGGNQPARNEVKKPVVIRREVTAPVVTSDIVLQRGDKVKHLSHPEWGVGTVMAPMRGAWAVYFPDAPESYMNLGAEELASGQIEKV